MSDVAVGIGPAGSHRDRTGAAGEEDISGDRPRAGKTSVADLSVGVRAISGIHRQIAEICQGDFSVPGVGTGADTAVADLGVRICPSAPEQLDVAGFAETDR